MQIHVCGDQVQRKCFDGSSEYGPRGRTKEYIHVRMRHSTHCSVKVFQCLCSGSSLRFSLGIALSSSAFHSDVSLPKSTLKSRTTMTKARKKARKAAKRRSKISTPTRLALARDVIARAMKAKREHLALAKTRKAMLAKPTTAPGGGDAMATDHSPSSSPRSTKSHTSDRVLRSHTRSAASERESRSPPVPRASTSTSSDRAVGPSRFLDSSGGDKDADSSYLRNSLMFRITVLQQYQSKASETLDRMKDMIDTIPKLVHMEPEAPEAAIAGSGLLGVGYIDELRGVHDESTKVLERLEPIIADHEGASKNQTIALRNSIDPMYLTLCKVHDDTIGVDGGKSGGTKKLGAGLTIPVNTSQLRGLRDVRDSIRLTLDNILGEHLIERQMLDEILARHLYNAVVIWMETLGELVNEFVKRRGPITR